MAQQVPLEEPKLGATSRSLANALFQTNPYLRAAAKMESGIEPDGYSFVLYLESPTGDTSRNFGIWIDESGVPSIGFGCWHSHGDLFTTGNSLADQVTAIVDIANAIFRDQFVLIVDVGGEHPGHTSVLDLRGTNALVNELTDKSSPGRVLVRSWSGDHDREVGLDNTSIDRPDTSGDQGNN